MSDFSGPEGLIIEVLLPLTRCCFHPLELPNINIIVILSFTVDLLEQIRMETVC